MITGGGGHTQSDSADPRKHSDMERANPKPGRAGNIWNDTLRATRRAIIAAIVWMVATLIYNQVAGAGSGSAQPMPPGQSGPAPAAPTGLAESNPMNNPEVFEGVLDAGG